MRDFWKGWAILGAIAFSAVTVTEAQAQTVRAWSPKPAQLAPYVNGNKPWTKLSEVLADKDPSQSWRQLIVDDANVSGTYVGMKVGDSTKGKLSADHRFAFIVWDGQVEVTIQGQTTFVATKGYMVQVPFRTQYSLKNVGKTPSLHFEIWTPEGTDLYPQNAATLPPPPPGKVWNLTGIDAPDTYARQGKPVFRDYLASPSQAEFVRDDRIFVNAIRGSGASNPPNGSDPGHFHSYGEFWFIMEGRISYLIEGMTYFAASPGDIVYATPGRWHLAGNDPPTTLRSTRIAINGYPAGSHHWPVNPQPTARPEQMTPPATRAMLPSATANGWYLSPTVKLSGYPNASSSEDELEYSEYWLDGAVEPTRYAGPFKISGAGTHTLKFRSVDKAGNVEDAKTVTLATIDVPPATLQFVPSTLNLRTSGGLVTAAIAVPAGYDLRTWGVADIRAQGAPAVSAAYSSDGRTIVATFNKSAFASVPAGDAVTVMVTGQFNYDGAQAPMAVSTVVRVIR